MIWDVSPNLATLATARVVGPAGLVLPETEGAYCLQDKIAEFNR